MAEEAKAETTATRPLRVFLAEGTAFSSDLTAEFRAAAEARGIDLHIVYYDHERKGWSQSRKEEPRSSLRSDLLAYAPDVVVFAKPLANFADNMPVLETAMRDALAVAPVRIAEYIRPDTKKADIADALVERLNKIPGNKNCQVQELEGDDPEYVFDVILRDKAIVSDAQKQR